MGSPVRLSLIRKHTFMNGDRIVVGLSIFLSILLGWVVTNGFGWKSGLLIGVLIWTGGVWLGRALYKADPYALQVWNRHRLLRETGNYFAGGGSRGNEPIAMKDFI